MNWLSAFIWLFFPIEFEKKKMFPGKTNSPEFILPD